MIRKVGEDGVDFEQVDMARFTGEYTPMVTLDVQARLEQSEKQEAYTNAYQMIIADPTNNLAEAKRIMYPKMMPELTAEEIEAIIAPQAPQIMPEPQPNPEMQDLATNNINAQDEAVMGAQEQMI